MRRSSSGTNSAPGRDFLRTILEGWLASRLADSVGDNYITDLD